MFAEKVVIWGARGISARSLLLAAFFSGRQCLSCLAELPWLLLGGLPERKAATSARSASSTAPTLAPNLSQTLPPMRCTLAAQQRLQSWWVATCCECATGLPPLPSTHRPNWLFSASMWTLNFALRS